MKIRATVPALQNREYGKEARFRDFSLLVNGLARWRGNEDPLWHSGLSGAFRDLAEIHGLSGIVGQVIIHGTGRPNGTAQGAVERYFTNVLLHERSLRLCARLVEVARRESIGVAVLKGPVLVEQGYRDGGLRGYGDVDLFTGSREDALRLVTSLGCSEIVEKDARGLSARLREPGKIGAEHDGIKLELMYPVSPPADPMQLLLVRHANSLVRVPGNLAELLDPDPNLHFVFLILHMAVNHMCSRLAWYWDLVMLVDAQRARFDTDWIARELEILQVGNVASAIGGVCERCWGITLPLPAAVPGWNRPFLNYATETRVLLHRTLDLWRAERSRKMLLRGVYAAGFYLICDPRAVGSPYAAAQYTNARLKHALPKNALLQARLTLALLRSVSEAFARLVCGVLRLRRAPGTLKKDKRYEMVAKRA